MFFASDNSGPVHPKVIEALARANDGYAMGYGNDPLTARAIERVRDLFEAPEAAVWFVTTGSAANALALACLSEPWDSIYCSPAAHIFEDECNAPEFYTGGAKLMTIGDQADKFTAEALAAEFARWPRSVHTPQHGPVSITNVTEKGTLYSLDEIRAIANVAHGQGLRLHLDGARFANACVALGATAAEMSWKAGVDAVSFGGTKNGLMAVEAVVVFDRDLARDFELRRKRAGHLLSKGRYLAAQMDAYLTDDLWLEMATSANRAGQRLAEGLRQDERIGFPWAPEANMIFAELPSVAHRRAREAGAVYHVMSGDPDRDPTALCRLVADWSAQDADVDRFIDLVTG
ncbi:low specificity L-threonine aldolase [Alphaproteobacteria bacterium GH1-50]|uniref:Low specificity L-threonine aldolase n=1 Tax=Kangsaoukella pontilimi TaxID=2691042 RepID=A0A7C9MFU0_9RHOB|nr:beta-eliminating lyase-related protein [Kangsaoukella pontilimi]MXQ07896.1 low specificity L-threonine aldolase [Kangsaoukella pontilimi]